MSGGVDCTVSSLLKCITVPRCCTLLLFFLLCVVALIAAPVLISITLRRCAALIAVFFTTFSLTTVSFSDCRCSVWGPLLSVALVQYGTVAERVPKRKGNYKHILSHFVTHYSNYCAHISTLSAGRRNSLKKKKNVVLNESSAVLKEKQIYKEKRAIYLQQHTLTQLPLLPLPIMDARAPVLTSSAPPSRQRTKRTSYSWRSRTRS